MPQHGQPPHKPQEANGRAIRSVSCLIAAACALAIDWPSTSAPQQRPHVFAPIVERIHAKQGPNTPILGIQARV